MTNGFLEEHDKSKVTVYISHEYGGKCPNGSAYKRVYPMWDVIEYKFTYNWEEYKKLYGDDYRWWYKYYKGK